MKFFKKCIADYIKKSDAMKICEEYSSHCFENSDARGQDIADRILDDIVDIPVANISDRTTKFKGVNLYEDNVYNLHSNTYICRFYL